MQGDLGKRLGFIGCGNMGGAILKGIVRAGLAQPEQMLVYDANPDAQRALVEAYGVRGAEDNADLVRRADIIFLAVKPIVCSEVLEDIRRHLLPGKILVSIVAGWAVEQLEQYLPSDSKVLRVMPNTPALVGEGMLCVSKLNNLEPKELETVTSLLACLGKVELVEEAWMDGVIGVSGSGPAFVYLMIEAMADAGVLQGLPRQLAYTLAAQTARGAATMVLDTGVHPGELKDRVCSPGGTTIEGVFELEKRGFRHAVMSAVDRTAEKSRAMAQQQKAATDLDREEPDFLED
ncbi:MAG: pyrroline-5-carboxylate reductase [Christensenellales bacterium]|jgi:pyrroline-5-carboxylate reductase